MATSEPSRSLPMQPAASHLIPSPSVLGGARIGVGGKPFAERKDVVAGLDHGKPTVFAADCNGAAVRGDQHIRLGGSNHQNGGDPDQQRADEPQRRLE